MTSPAEKTFEQRVRDQHAADSGSRMFTGHAVMALDELQAELATLKSQLTEALEERDDWMKSAAAERVKAIAWQHQLTAATSRAERAEAIVNDISYGRVVLSKDEHGWGAIRGVMLATGFETPLEAALAVHPVAQPEEEGNDA